jgi:hypothetical protein
VRDGIWREVDSAFPVIHDLGYCGVREIRPMGVTRQIIVGFDHAALCSTFIPNAIFSKAILSKWGGISGRL